jgi:hypothetical protein
MTHRIRTAYLIAFTSCALVVACAEAPDTAQITAVDQLISATDGAMLTLNELDRERYQRSDSLFTMQQASFADRFADTLGRDVAKTLGNQFLALRTASVMGEDHVRVLDDLIASGERLRALRTQLAQGTMRRAEGANAIAAEQAHHTALIVGVHAVMDNYRVLQRAWDRRDSVSNWLADAQAPETP